MSCTDLFQIDATIVANEFIDKYMPRANGDYVKVYLFLLKNGANGTDIAAVAEALALTEGDVRRAVRYWEEQGIVSLGSAAEENSEAAEEDAEAVIEDGELISDAKKQGSRKSSRTERSVKTTVKPVAAVQACAPERMLRYSGKLGKTAEKQAPEAPEASAGQPEESAAEIMSGQTSDGSMTPEELRSYYCTTEGKTVLNRLNEDAEFTQLLLIVQKYRSRILTEKDEQVLAYLYDGLHLPCDVLDYLVAYCVEAGHNSMRYIEKTGLDWANIGIRDVKAAQRRTRAFDRAVQEKKSRNSVKTAAKGITRSADLDDWVKTQVLEKI